MTRRPLWVCVFLIPVPLSAQPPDDEAKTRSLWDSTFLNQRPPARKPPGATAGTVASQRPAADAALIGLTFWRLRESRDEDDKGTRLLIHGEGREHEWTPERIA